MRSEGCARPDATAGTGHEGHAGGEQTGQGRQGRERRGRPRPVVQCSTGSLAPYGGGRYSDVNAVIRGVRVLGWPAVELRLWEEWEAPDFAGVARQVTCPGTAVHTVHAPPETERLLGCAGCGEIAETLLFKCAAGARVAGARGLVLHAWDLRLTDFRLDLLIENLNKFALAMPAGLALSVETIPGHVEVLPDVLRDCPDVMVTVDTQWVALQGSWEFAYGLMPRVSNLHVQTRVEVGEDGSVLMGCTRAGSRFDAEKVVREFVSLGFEGTVTLEPQGVPGITPEQLRRALMLLEEWASF